MRIKTILFFLILVAGVAFSQNTGPDKDITLTKIIEFLEIGRYNSIRMEALIIGYKTIAPYEFSNGRHSFKLIRLDNKTELYYQESWMPERNSLLKEEASRLNFAITKETKDYLEMSYEKFVLRSFTNDRIEVSMK